MKRTGLFALMLTLAVAAASAGDIARFANLGFSPDSRVFLFGQYGITHPEGHPFAEIYAVDVPGNVFLPQGVQRRTFSRTLSGGQDGSGALYTLLPLFQPLIGEHQIDHLAQGRIIYLFIDGEDDPQPRISFRDFRTGTRYTLEIIQESRGRGAEGSAAFHLNLQAHHSDGTTLERQIGRPTLFRDGVNRYRVGRVIVSPDNSSLVVVVERITDIAGGRRIRYMVETLRLR
ncbi:MULTISPECIES: DUF2259 domain-containing protein [Alkalispirochaeta]|nr:MULTISPECIES: DUF2259 domain-containing protein [Alkalispirochaeta]